jgi:hypothetical protein
MKNLTYFLSLGKSLTRKDVIHPKHLSFKLLLLSALLLLVSPLSNAETPKDNANNHRVAQSASVPNSFEDYRKTCLQRATGEGLPRDVAEDLCNCTIKTFQARYTLSQFQALVQKSKTNKNAQRTLTDVGEACLDEVLYE